MPIAKNGLSERAKQLEARYGVREGWQVTLEYDTFDLAYQAAIQRVAFTDVSATGKLWIQGQSVKETLKQTFGVSPDHPTELKRFPDGWITQINRQEYYAIIALEQLNHYFSQLQKSFQEQHAHVTSVTHGKDIIAVFGPQAASVLGKICALDFQSFDKETALSGHLADVSAIIARCDLKHLPCYEIHLDRSYSEYALNVLLDAAEDFNGQLIGLDALNILKEG